MTEKQPLYRDDQCQIVDDPGDCGTKMLCMTLRDGLQTLCYELRYDEGSDRIHISEGSDDDFEFNPRELPLKALSVIAEYFKQ